VTTDDGARLPRSGELLASFGGAGRHDDGEPLVIAHLLARNHEQQWSAEDLCRSPSVSDEVLGRVKRRIDRLNGHRVELIDRLDAWVAAHLRQDSHATRHTETYGMIVDRMAIGWVRVGQMSGHARLPIAQAQLAELASAHDTLVVDIEARCRSLPAWRSLKFYRAPTSATRS
jgi:hypothetical protein